MNNVKHIFFDLDHTIWDFEKNSSKAIRELFFLFGLDKKIESVDDFIATYQSINAIYWGKYRTGEITKEIVRTGRFIDILNKYNINDHENMAKEFGDQYVNISPLNTELFPHSHETLEYLSNKYPLHIITNGFIEIVDIKLHHSRLTNYFDVVLCSEEVGVNKPNPKVFEIAMQRANAIPEESVMIGDSYEVDIKGAESCGMKTVYFNTKNEKVDSESVEIHSLRELMEIF